MAESTKPTSLSEHFKGQNLSVHGQKWDELWGHEYTPWDRGFPSPALTDFLSERKEILPTKDKKKKALVAGCGRGYDVLLLSSWGFDAYGLDVSSKAVEVAKGVQKEVDGKGVYETKEGVEKGRVNWIAGDFFKGGFLKEVEGEPVFDFIYDYTFLSALPPPLRPAWAKRYSELLAPEGRLFCLEWPTHRPDFIDGPPWALPSKVYLAHLPRPGIQLPYGEDGDLVESEVGEPSADGLERVEHYQPKTTYKAGYVDGKMVDWVSIWAHPK